MVYINKNNQNHWLGGFYVVVSIGLLLYGIYASQEKLPQETEIVEVSGVATKVKHQRMGRKTILTFDIDEKSFQYASNDVGYEKLDDLVMSDSVLTLGIIPGRSKGLGCWRFYRAREGDNIVVPFSAVLKEERDGINATLYFAFFFAFGFGVCAVSKFVGIGNRPA